MTTKVNVFTNQTENGDSLLFNTIGTGSPGNKVSSFVTVYGNFDGAQLDMKYKADDSNNYLTGDDPITSTFAQFLEINPNVPYLFTLSNAGVSTDITITIYNATIRS